MTEKEIETKIQECKNFLAETEETFLLLKYKRDYRRRRRASLEQRLFDRKQGQLEFNEQYSEQTVKGTP